MNKLLFVGLILSILISSAIAQENRKWSYGTSIGPTLVITGNQKQDLLESDNTINVRANFHVY